VIPRPLREISRRSAALFITALICGAIPAQGAESAAAAKAIPSATTSVAPPQRDAFVTPASREASIVRRLVYIPFENPSNKDGYIEFANGEFAKKLSANGFTLQAKPGLDQVDARLGAKELCVQERAEGILVATRIDHDQQYRKGVAHSFFGAVLGIVPIVGNIVTNGINTVISDDRSVNRATLGALLVDCTGRKIWGETVQGDNSHYGRNEAAGGSGAIDDGLTKLVASMIGTLDPSASTRTHDPASVAQPAAASSAPPQPLRP
jgi:hypothetical protein